MSLITPSNLQYILNTSILSRVIVLALQFTSNILLSDHEADAYRNKYHLSLTTNNSTSLEFLPDSYWYLYKSIEGLTKWDAQYFLEISLYGYTSEQHLAFLPLFPVSVSIIRQSLFKHGDLNLKFLNPTLDSNFEQDQVVSTSDLQSYIGSALVGVALNNFLYFPLACIALYLLTKLVKRRDEKYTKNVVWWFCFNPASIFFSACYSESLFSALTFTAMFMIEYKSQKYQERDDNIKPRECIDRTEFIPLDELNRLLHACLPSLAFLALSTATRSNGLATIGFLGYQVLLKYAPILYTDRNQWGILLYLAAILEWLQDVIVLFVSSLIAASGYITFQIYSYTKFCLDTKTTTTTTKQKGIIYIKPDWCKNTIPHAYGQVQSKYWDVGLFRYYQVKQLPNFLLALPVAYFILTGSMEKAKAATRSQRGKRQLAYYIHALILTIFCGLSINVQVTTRLIASACPALYWICADTSAQSRHKRKLLAVYFIGYFILGSILHPNFYPWT